MDPILHKYPFHILIFKAKELFKIKKTEEKWQLTIRCDPNWDSSM